MNSTLRTASQSPTYPRICMLSMRNLEGKVARCVDYEFEDVICEIDDVDLIAPEPRTLYAVGEKVGNRIARHLKLPTYNPCVNQVKIDKDYDLFVAICMSPRDLMKLHSIKGWREHCRKTVCYIDELWAASLYLWSGHLRTLSRFDHVLLGCNETVSHLQDKIKKPCRYMPAGIDTTKFCPYPNPPQRSVDVYNLGRRHEETHERLFQMAEQKKIFYIYETLRNSETDNYLHHRELFSNIAKRSRYFLVNRAKFNKKSETGGQQEIGFRYFEGAAAGTVMIGEAVETEMFEKYFGWQDSVIEFPFDAGDIATFLEDLDSQPERLAEIRRENIIQSLLRHDWVYRWRKILDVCSLTPMPALAEREKRLLDLATIVKESGTR